MKICYFGIYDPEYSRNKILISGLRQNGIEVTECVSRKKGFSKYFDLIKKHRAIKNNYDVIIVGFPGFQSVILAKFITKRPIIFNAFVYMYDSIVLDRAQVRRGSLKALYFWCLDKISMSISDVVLFDTEEHIKFVSREFNIKHRKFKRIFLGTDTLVFYPREKPQSDLFKVVFYGHYIPLQGTEYIVKAAKLLEGNKDIVFEIIGGGKGKEKMLDLAKSLGLKNIDFTENVSLVELAERMSSADVCLGIFGDTGKTMRVIPNKVYDSMALSRPLITADTPAIRELFGPEEVFFTKTASPESIAEAILKVKSDRENAKAVAKRGFDKFTRTVGVEALGLELKKIIESLIK